MFNCMVIVLLLRLVSSSSFSHIIRRYSRLSKVNHILEWHHLKNRSQHVLGLDKNNASDSANIDARKAIQSNRKINRDESKPSARQFWINESDECVFIKENQRSAKFTIRGKPLPLHRHRTSKGFIYNPSSAAQELFRDSLLHIMPREHHPRIVDDGISGETPITFFSENDFLDVSIVFRLKRPRHHFVNNTPGEGRMKKNAPGKFHFSRTDVDNLAKFVLDSLNGLLYADDRQVVSLKAMKILDSEGTCDGAIDVFITVLQDE